MRSSLALAALLLLGCSSSDAGAPVAARPRPWQRLATPTSALGEIRGLRPVRGIVHSHSPWSHDACDGEGLTPEGTPVPSCAADLRRGMCEAAEDFVFLTDHSAHMAQPPFEDLLYFGDGDEPVFSPGGDVIGNRLDCGDGRWVLVTAGNENALMSLGLERHLPGDPAARDALYGGDDAATAQAMRDAGALVWIPHTESRTLEYLRQMPFDGMEVYNLHAAIDPDIREQSLGLDSFGAVAGILPFTRRGEEDPQPDLAFLGFFEDLPRYAELWDALLPERKVPGAAGTDVHQNTFPGTLRDEERGDSYRRLMRWFSNVALVDAGAELTPAAVKSALREGRSYIAFEILGVPAGFDFHAEQAGAAIEMGGTAPAGAKIIARAPEVLDLDPAVAAPEISLRLLRVTAAGAEVVSEGAAAEIAAADPGAYRVEVRITPRHLRSYLGTAPDPYIKSYPWVISNPIYVE
ncbi:MAG: hypothetical protein IT372_35970 [Polyangiaceae bacterium]|nr:hypothetical protein [Polyangiaceae bacterium]